MCWICTVLVLHCPNTIDVLEALQTQNDGRLRRCATSDLSLPSPGILDAPNAFTNDPEAFLDAPDISAQSKSQSTPENKSLNFSIRRIIDSIICRLTS